MTDLDTSDRDVNRAIRSWLHEDRHEDASRIAGAVLDQVDTTRQRRTRWWLAWRTPHMNKIVGFAGTAAAVVAVAVVGINLLPGGGSGTGGSQPSVSPTIAPSATPQASPVALPLSGPIEAGTYLIRNGTSSFRVTIPEGWDIVVEDGATTSGSIAISRAKSPSRSSPGHQRVPGRVRERGMATAHRTDRRTIWLPPSTLRRTRTSPSLPRSRSADALASRVDVSTPKGLDIDSCLKPSSGSGPVPRAATTSHSAHRAELTRLHRRDAVGPDRPLHGHR